MSLDMYIEARSRKGAQGESHKPNFRGKRVYLNNPDNPGR